MVAATQLTLVPLAQSQDEVDYLRWLNGVLISPVRALEFIFPGDLRDQTKDPPQLGKKFFAEVEAVLRSIQDRHDAARNYDLQNRAQRSTGKIIGPWRRVPKSVRSTMHMIIQLTYWVASVDANVGDLDTAMRRNGWVPLGRRQDDPTVYLVYVVQTSRRGN